MKAIRVFVSSIWKTFIKFALLLFTKFRNPQGHFHFWIPLWVWIFPILSTGSKLHSKIQRRFRKGVRFTKMMYYSELVQFKLSKKKWHSSPEDSLVKDSVGLCHWDHATLFLSATVWQHTLSYHFISLRLIWIQPYWYNWPATK